MFIYETQEGTLGEEVSSAYAVDAQANFTAHDVSGAGLDYPSLMIALFEMPEVVSGLTQSQIGALRLRPKCMQETA